jgi:hypothetical protein
MQVQPGHQFDHIRSKLKFLTEEIISPYEVLCQQVKQFLEIPKNYKMKIIQIMACFYQRQTRLRFGFRTTWNRILGCLTSSKLFDCLSDDISRNPIRIDISTDTMRKTMTYQWLPAVISGCVNPFEYVVITSSD